MNQTMFIRRIWLAASMILSGSIVQASELANALGATGDICWQTDPQILGSVTLKAGFFNIGGGHFIFAGKTLKPDGRLIATGNGNAEFYDNEVHLSALLTGVRSNAVFSETVHAVLDGETLNGTLQVIFEKVDASASEPVIFYDTGTMTRVICPE